ALPGAHDGARDEAVVVEIRLGVGEGIGAAACVDLAVADLRGVGVDGVVGVVAVQGVVGHALAYAAAGVGPDLCAVDVAEPVAVGVGGAQDAVVPAAVLVDFVADDLGGAGEHVGVVVVAVRVVGDVALGLIARDHGGLAGVAEPVAVGVDIPGGRVDRVAVDLPVAVVI